jgi:hypothetical protein
LSGLEAKTFRRPQTPMIHIYVNTFVGLRGADLQVTQHGLTGGVEIFFRVDKPHTHGDAQAFKFVSEIIRQAELDWVEPSSDRWVVHLDTLKTRLAIAQDLSGLSWFKGQAEVKPELRVTEYPLDLSGLTTPRPPDSYVALSIQPENIVPKIPRAFASYSWDDDTHKAWVRDLAVRLRTRDGVEVTLDQWATAPGDQLPHFMETAVRDNEFVLIVCTPRYKQKSDGRIGGVGYEGDIMTGEVLTKGNRRKFIPILRLGNSEDAIPSWLGGVYYIDLRGNPYSEKEYNRLLTHLHGIQEQAPPIGHESTRTQAKSATQVQPPSNLEGPIRITGIIEDEVGRPRNDGTRGSGLYSVPFRLSRLPPREWAEVFVQTWNHPSQWTTMHRPGIAKVVGDKVILDGTTLEEVEHAHRDTLKLAVDEANRLIAEQEAKKQAEADRKREEQRRHEESVREAAKRISFD